VPHSASVAAGGTYIGTATLTLPALPPGTYFFLVSEDRRVQVKNDTNRDNNLAAAAAPLTLSVPALTVATATTGQFSATHPDQYFQLTVAPGQTLRLALASSATAGLTELFVR